MMTGTYEIIYADPPWRYSAKKVQGAAENHYPTMSMLMGNIRLTGLSFMTISQFFELLIRLTVSVQNMDISALLMRESYPFIRL